MKKLSKPNTQQLKKTATRIGVKSALAALTPTVAVLGTLAAAAIDARIKLEKKAASL